MASKWWHRPRLTIPSPSLLNSCILEVWPMNCRNSIFRLTNNHFSPSRGQNQGFCPFFASRTAIFGAFEDKSAHFVLFESTFASFWALSRTKLRFLSSVAPPEQHYFGHPSAKIHFLRAFCLRNGTIPASRAQKSTFCALLPSRRALFRPPERKIPLFARFCLPEGHFSSLPSAKTHILRAFGLPDGTISVFRAQE